MSLGFTNFASMQMLLPLITVGIYVIAIIIGLDCIWRVEKNLDLFLKFYVGGLIILGLRMLAGALGFIESTYWTLLVPLVDALAGIMFLVSLLVMYKIIRSLNFEKSKLKKK
jgi:hypothetical protein